MLKARTFLIASIALLALPGAAGASVTIGPANPNPNPAGAHAVNELSGTLLFTTAAPGSILVTPSEGVISSWSLYTDDVKGEATAQLQVLSPAGGKNYAVTGSGPLNPLPEGDASGAAEKNVLHTFPARVPVAAGVMLGVTLSFKPGGYAEAVRTSEPASTIGYLGGGCAPVPAPGKTAEACTQNEEYLAMNATLEPDADHDGLGDETQDSCVGVCAPPAPIAAVVTPPAAKKKCKKGKKLKRGKCVKKHKKRKHKHKK